MLGGEAVAAGGESGAAQASGEALSSEELATCVGVLERLAQVLIDRRQPDHHV